jgi:hypothetical protein
METTVVATARDQKIGIVVSVLCLLFLFIFLYLTTFEKADPGPEELKVPTEIPLTALVIKNLKVEESGSKGGGSPSDAPVDPKPQPKTEKVLTSKKINQTKVNSGQASTTTTNNSQSEDKTIKKSNNPFGTGGSDGKKGAGFGGDEGDGSNGTGDGLTGGGSGKKDGKRTRLTDPTVDDIESDANCTVQMRVKIDENGNVISATCTSLTTTISQLIKNKVCAATIRTARYNKKPGAGIEEAFITVLIRAK